MSRAFDPTLYLVIGPDDTLGRDPVWVVERAIAGGVTMVQLRWKHAAPQALLELAQRMHRVTSRHGVPLLINDDVEVAARANVEGVHVGQGDLAPQAARARIGSDAIVGLSIASEAQLATLDPGLVDYAGVGPVTATATKPDHAAPLGVLGFAALRARLSVPVVAIGGVGLANARELRTAGADGLAVVSALCTASDPELAARTLRARYE